MKQILLGGFFWPTPGCCRCLSVHVMFTPCAAETLELQQNRYQVNLAYKLVLSGYLIELDCSFLKPVPFRLLGTLAYNPHEVEAIINWESQYRLYQPLSLVG